MSESLEPTDPTRATSAAVNRRVFVGMSATATALGGTLAGALAQGPALGRPHPPLVAENDPAIATGRPPIPSGTRTLDSYYAAPRRRRPDDAGAS